MKVYLAGPMRGYAEWNFPAFDEAERAWRAAGRHVFSPASVCKVLGYASYDDAAATPGHPQSGPHLRHVLLSDLACLMACDCVAVLPGWERSVGATMEVAVAQFLGLPVYDARHPTSLEPLEVPAKPWHREALNAEISILRSKLQHVVRT